MNQAGLIYALLAYFLWGVVPIFWKELQHVDAVQIVAHRVVWSLLMALLAVFILRQWSTLKQLLAQPKLLLKLGLCSLLISVNWSIFIWAVNADFVVETSLGYYINPLITVLFGLLFFGESLRRNQVLALALAALGVLYLVFVQGKFPLIALSLALTFAAYGAVKKTMVSVPALHGLSIETGIMVVPALVYLGYVSATGEAQFGEDNYTNLLLIVAGLVTLAPLMFFSIAAQRISMTALGLSQYLGPTLQLIIAVWLYHEPFELEQQISFGLVWSALVIYSIDQLNHRRNKRRLIASSAGPVRIE